MTKPVRYLPMEIGVAIFFDFLKKIFIDIYC